MVEEMKKDIELLEKAHWTYENIRRDVLAGLSVNEIIGRNHCSHYPVYKVRKEVRNANHRTKIS